MLPQAPRHRHNRNATEKEREIDRERESERVRTIRPKETCKRLGKRTTAREKANCQSWHGRAVKSASMRSGTKKGKDSEIERERDGETWAERGRKRHGNIPLLGYGKISLGLQRRKFLKEWTRPICFQGRYSLVNSFFLEFFRAAAFRRNPLFDSLLVASTV